MAWWDVSGLTPIAAFDGKPDSVSGTTWLNRVSSNNATIGGSSVASGQYFGLSGTGVQIPFASQIDIPAYFVLAVFFSIKAAMLFGYKEPNDTANYILDIEPSGQMYNSSNGSYSNWKNLSSPFVGANFACIVRNSTGTFGMVNQEAAFTGIAASTIMSYIKGIGYYTPTYNLDSVDALHNWAIWEGEASIATVGAIRDAMAAAVLLPPPNPRVLGGAFSYRPTVNPNQVLTGRVRNPMLSRKNMVFGGFKTISGIVTVEGIPASRRVRCHDVATGIMVAEKWSQSNGYYEFPLLDASRKFYVVAFDHEEVYNMVGKDRIRFR